MEVKSREWEEDLRDEVVGSLLDFCLATFHTIIYMRGDYPRGVFFFTKLFDLKIPVCYHPQVAEYIEICSKKMLRLLIANQLEGVEFHILHKRETIERFVITLDGHFMLDSMFKNSEDQSIGDANIIEMKLVLKNALMELMKVHLTPKHVSLQNVRRFKIVLGVTPECANNKTPGPCKDDPDMYIFPWAKPICHENKKSGDAGINRKSPILVPIDSFVLFDSLVSNFFVLTYGKSIVKDEDVIHRRSEKFKTKHLNSPQNYRSITEQNKPSSSSSSKVSPLISPTYVNKKNYDTSPKSSIHHGREDREKSPLYRRPILSSSRSLGINLKSTTVSPLIFAYRDISSISPPVTGTARTFRKKTSARRRL